MIGKKVDALCVEYAPDQNSSTSDIDIFTKLLGPCSIYLRGLGRYVKPLAHPHQPIMPPILLEFKRKRGWGLRK